MTEPRAAEVLDVRERLAHLLRVQGVPAEPTDRGFVVQAGSATVHVDLVAEGAGPVLIDVWAAVVDPVAPSHDLHTFAATFMGMFGAMVVEDTGTGAQRLVFRQALRADPLTPEAVVSVLSIVAQTVDDLDDGLIARFR